MEPLIEREVELATLNAYHADAAGGGGSVVLVTGAAGTGKTTLLQAFTEQVARAGGLVLTAAGVRAESTLPMGLLTELFAALPASAAGRFAGLLDQAAAVPGPVSSRTMRGVWEALRELSDETPVLVAIDDIQHADAASLQVLLSIVRRVRGARALVVLAETEYSHRASPLFRAELLREPACRHIHLARLSPDGVGRLAGPGLDSATTTELAELSGGNPLLAHALLSDHGRVRREADQHTPGLVVGDAYGQAVLSCVHRFEPVMLTVVSGLAVLGEPATPGTLARMLEVDAADAAWALQGLQEIGLVDAGRFRHQAAAAAVLDSMTGAERARWHRRIARVLHDDGEPAAVVARHLIAASHVAEEWALAELREAAEQADLGDDVDFAVQCLELAMTAARTEPERAAITMRLLRVQWRVNPATAARHLEPLTENLLEGLLPPGDASVILRALCWHGNLAAVERVLGVAAASEACFDPEVLARLRIAQQWLRVFCPSLLASTPAVPAAEVSPIFSQLVQAATALAEGLTRDPDADTVTVAEQMLQGGRLDDDSFDWIEAAMLTLVHADRADRAALWCGPLFEQAAARGAATWQARLAAVQGEIALHQGDLAAAERWAHAALTLIPARGWGVAIGGPLATLILAATESGRFEQAARQLRRATPPTMFQTRYGLLYLHARAQYHLATGRLHDALVDFLNCGEQMEQSGQQPTGAAPWRIGAATVYLRMGEDDLARQLVGELMHQPSTASSRAAARRLLEAAGDLPQRPGTLWASAQLAPPAARIPAQRQDGSAGWVRPQQALLHHTGTVLTGPDTPLPESDENADPPPDGSGDGTVLLSDAERRVAELVAVGHTNREVAQALFITVSTVEQHLTRVYRKLNLNGRSDLSVRFRLDPPEPS